VLSPPCIRQRANRRTARRGTADCVVGARLRAEGGAGDESPYCFAVPEVVPRVPAVNVIRHASALHRRGCYRMGCSFPAHCRKSTMQRSCLHHPGLNGLSTRKPWEVGATLSRTCRTTEAQKLMKPGAFSFFNFPASAGRTIRGPALRRSPALSKAVRKLSPYTAARSHRKPHAADQNGLLLRSDGARSGRHEKSSATAEVLLVRPSSYLPRHPRPERQTIRDAHLPL
jgi:hypothetical protein